MLSLALEPSLSGEDTGGESGSVVYDQKFSSEAALVEKLSRSLISSLSQHTVEVIPEFETANGIADLVVTRLRRDWRQSVIHRLPPAWAYTFRCLPYRASFTTELVAALAGVTTATARAALKQFCAAGLCEPAAARSRWMKVVQPRPIANEIVSIEAKLRDWRKAFFQANRYRAYSTQSWVVMDAACAAPAARNLDVFRVKNIGLAVVSSRSGLTVLHEPRKEAAWDPIAYWRANVEIGLRLRKTSRYTL